MLHGQKYEIRLKAIFAIVFCSYCAYNKNCIVKLYFQTAFSSVYPTGKISMKSHVGSGWFMMVSAGLASGQP